MFRQDYIMRQIAQLVEALNQVFSLTKARQFEEALELIDQELERLLGRDSHSMGQLSAAQIVTGLSLAESFGVGRAKCGVVAKLLKEAGDIYVARQELDESYGCYLQALDLLLELLLEDQAGLGMPDYAPTVEQLLTELETYALPLETNLRLFRYYEQVGAYAQAENILFQGLETGPDKALIDMGLAFYRRLQNQSDDRLAAGNLPREEVEAGLAELETYR